MTKEQKSPQASATSIDEGLINIDRWVCENPPSEGWRPHIHAPSRIQTIHLHPHCRMTIQMEQAVDVGYGLVRSDRLAELGIGGADLDSKAFAKSLLLAIQDHLSIRNLRDLKDTFSVALEEEEAHRLSFIQKMDTQQRKT